MTPAQEAKYLRKYALRLTQDELSAAMGGEPHQTTISKMEGGKVPVKENYLRHLRLLAEKKQPSGES